MAITEACSWLRGLLSEICDDFQTTIVFYDSQSDIFLTKDKMFHEKTKHIDVHYFFFLEVIARGDIVVTKVST